MLATTMSSGNGNDVDNDGMAQVRLRYGACDREGSVPVPRAVDVGIASGRRDQSRSPCRRALIPPVSEQANRDVMLQSTEPDAHVSPTLAEQCLESLW
jgi:hypothetical protein